MLLSSFVCGEKKNEAYEEVRKQILGTNLIEQLTKPEQSHEQVPWQIKKKQGKRKKRGLHL